jgi:hypothetical protein
MRPNLYRVFTNFEGIQAPKISKSMQKICTSQRFAQPRSAVLLGAAMENRVPRCGGTPTIMA